jgi:subtilisin-like proprotein convertase family protein
MQTRSIALALSGLALAFTSLGASAGNYTASNNTPLTISDSGPASAYPSTINLAGTTGTVTRVTVTLTGLSHTFPGDLDILLVSPSGQPVMLMSDVGGTNDISGANLTFSMAALNNLPDAIASGTYIPAHPSFGDAMAAPAPADAGVSGLGAFNGSSANGNWSLFIMDDAAGDTGTMLGWTLDVSTDPLPVAPALTFSNTAPVTIPDSGAGAIYPSTIAVAGTLGTVSDVSVSLKGLNHTFAGDLDILLVSPSGQQVMLLSDVGSGSDYSNTNVTFSMDAMTAMPAIVTSGTFLPSALASGDVLPAPAPGTNGVSGLAAFNGSTANGTWSLYINDDAAGDSGSLAGGWEITFRGITVKTCASEGYTGTKLEWCKNICERGYTGSTLAMWIRRWTDRYRTLPYCALEDK